MQRFISGVTLLALIGSISMPGLAAELRSRGFFENVFPHLDQNTSDQDLDMTRNDDQIFFGRQRVRLFFDFIASDTYAGNWPSRSMVSMAPPASIASDPLSAANWYVWL